MYVTQEIIQKIENNIIFLRDQNEQTQKKQQTQALQISQLSDKVNTPKPAQDLTQTVLSLQTSVASQRASLEAQATQIGQLHQENRKHTEQINMFLQENNRKNVQIDQLLQENNTKNVQIDKILKTNNEYKEQLDKLVKADNDKNIMPQYLHKRHIEKFDAENDEDKDPEHSCCFGAVLCTRATDSDLEESSGRFSCCLSLKKWVCFGMTCIDDTNHNIQS